MEKRGRIFQTPAEESPRKQKAKQKAMKISINQGAAESASFSLGNKYITPFALAINAQPIHIGILSAISGLLNPLSQLYGSKLMQKYSRKTIVTKFVFLAALMWIPIAFIAFLYFKQIFQPYLIYTLIIFYTLFVIFASILFPAWFSWIGDIIPENERGRFFAKRNSAKSLTGIAVALITALILDVFKTKGLALIGFMIFFVLAFTFKLVSYSFFKKKYSPKFKLKKGDYFSFWTFIKRKDNYRMFTIFNLIFYFSLMIASPFFAVYMLKELNFSYATFMIVTLSMSVFYLLFQPLAGKFSDKYGNKKLFAVSVFLFPLTPLLWIFFKSPVFLILFPQFISGVANAAFVISHTNFTYDSVIPKHRGICITYANIMAGIGIFAGSLIGGFLLHNFYFSMNPFFIVFGISAVLRLSTAIIFIEKIKEPKDSINRLPPMHLNLLHPFKTVHAEIGWFKTIFR